ncbi:MAG: hypothetical protein RXN78_00400 [Vulcanisaeta sp.]
MACWSFTPALLSVIFPSSPSARVVVLAFVMVAVIACVVVVLCPCSW